MENQNWTKNQIELQHIQKQLFSFKKKKTCNYYLHLFFEEEMHTGKIFLWP